MRRPVTRSMASNMELQAEGEQGNLSRSSSSTSLASESAQDNSGPLDVSTEQAQSSSRTTDEADGSQPPQELAEDQEDEVGLLQRQLAALRSENQELRRRLGGEVFTRDEALQDLELAKGTLRRRDQQLESLRSEVQGMEQENKCWTEAAARYKEERNQARAQLEILREGAKELADLQTSHSRVQRQVQFLNAQLEESGCHRRQLEQELSLFRQGAAGSQEETQASRNLEAPLTGAGAEPRGTQTTLPASPVAPTLHPQPHPGPAVMFAPSGLSYPSVAYPYQQSGPPGVYQPAVVCAGQPPSAPPGIQAAPLPSSPPPATMHPAPAVLPNPHTGSMGVHVPMPRQMEFDGTSISFEAFMNSFHATAQMAGWTEDLKLYRLKSSLRGEAMEYFSQQLGTGEGASFDAVVQVLRSRFEEKKAAATYLAQLNARQLQPKESITQYVADLKKLASRAYPTAGSDVRDAIVLQRFLAGLQDPQASLQVGMLQPKSLEEAQTAYETYVSLKGSVPRPPKAHAVQPEPAAGPAPWQADLDRLGTKVEASLTKMQGTIDTALSQSSRQGQDSPQRETRPRESPVGSQGGGTSAPGRRRAPRDVRCYECQEWGHYARGCPNRPREDQPSRQNSSHRQGAPAQQSEN